MEEYKNRKRALSPSTMFDTNRRVPRLDTYSQDQTALLRAIEEHGTCFISQDGKHIQINRFRLSA
ncbi:hypothetical protein BDN70DRAFT_931511 [Pholiota conissans]|uniref:Uncharacterized protein n=1 Tax=Pholiota conissans TaxID=109636 RepID=A0A9P6D1S4_9AGAR|nr:hypothetical protein BDN70DRAFT_931511 [Pholiota conissans]